MINIKNYKQLKLEDVAKYERVKDGKMYPKGSTLVRVSATTGEVEYLEKEGRVDRKYAVIIPNKEINPKYFNIVIKLQDLFFWK